MRSIPNKFSQYADRIRGLASQSLNDPAAIPNLRMESCQIRNREVTMCYAPFDHVNRDARIVIVGMTPGRQQAANALRAAQVALMKGMPLDKAAKEAKVFASFSGSMRGNLVRMPMLHHPHASAEELAELPNTILVPLGPKVTAALNYLASLGKIDKNRIMAGLPHPSGANNERIAYFLGEKAADLCSAKTNTVALDTAREALRARVSQLK